MLNKKDGSVLNDGDIITVFIVGVLRFKTMMPAALGLTGRGSDR